MEPSKAPSTKPIEDPAATLRDLEARIVSIRDSL
jgi:hypothetical protein